MEETRATIEELKPWFHNLHLPDGQETAPDHPLGDFPAFKWKQIAPHLPRDLAGWQVIDIGCNAGFYSFELARRDHYRHRYRSALLGSGALGSAEIRLRAAHHLQANASL